MVTDEFAIGARNDMVILSTALYNTLAHKIRGKFPKVAEIDRRHAKILLEFNLIEKADMGKYLHYENPRKIWVPTVECMAALDLIMGPVGETVIGGTKHVE